MKHSTLTLVLLTTLMFSSTAQAESVLIKYKNYQIPVPVESNDTFEIRECADGKPRVIVTSDISNNGDPDDIQSMVHLLATSNQFKTLGLISTPGANIVNNEKSHLQNMVNAYALDYQRSSPESLRSIGYPHPDEFTQVIRQGVSGRTIISNINYSPTIHKGAKLILDEADKVLDGTNCGPLYVLVWGSIADVALALKESKRRVDNGIAKQGIEKAIRVYFISSTNRMTGPDAYSYIFDNFLTKDLLWFIQSEHTFRGINDKNLGGPNANKQQYFLDKVKNRGCLGYVLNETGLEINMKENKPIKIGDTPSLLYVMNGDLDDPTSSSWGGQYKKVQGFSNWWVDRSITDVYEIKDKESIRNYADSKTVGKHIDDIYTDWEKGMKRFNASLPRTCSQIVNSTLN